MVVECSHISSETFWKLQIQYKCGLGKGLTITVLLIVLREFTMIAITSGPEMIEI